MERYDVHGMSCAACVAHVEKAVREVEGVKDVSVNLLTNSMVVDGAASHIQICRAVEAAGYEAVPKAEGMSKNSSSVMSSEDLTNSETPMMVRRLALSVFFLLPLMYVSMGHMMFGWPLPSFLDGNHIGMGLYEMLFAIIIMYINGKFFVSGITGTLHGAPNMDTLVALGSGVSFGYSLVILFAMTVAASRGDMEAVAGYMDGLYFESAAMILTLITVGKTLESYSKGKTTNALKGLIDLAPKMATVVRDDKEMTIPAADVRVGDVFIVKAGEAIPVDGVVTDGVGSVDESSLTGESVPVDKEEGDEVSVGTINMSGYLTCEAKRVGADTTLSRIVSLVSDAAATKAPIARVADRVAGVFVPVVLVIALITAIVWIALGAPFGTALSHAITVLVISCPCALGLATPVAIMVGNGVGAKNGILYKNSVSLEQAGRAKIVVMDKTGTVTKGAPHVTDVLAAEGSTVEELLMVAVSLEEKSSHPLGNAVVEYGRQNGIETSPVTDYRTYAGKGISGLMDEISCHGGKRDYIVDRIVDFGCNEKAAAFDEKNDIDKYLSAGKTPLYFSTEKKLLGAIMVADMIKPDSAQAVSELKEMGLYTVMLTGDNEKTAAAIGRESGVDKVIAGVLPDAKEEVIRELQKHGRVVMVGDGINDAPALTRADVGFAIGAGTDIAIDAADVVLMNSNLLDVPAAIRLSKSVIRNIHENLFWAFFYNVIGIPLAAGVWIPITGWSLSPMFGAAAMSLSSFCVVMNALRLNLFNIRKPGSFLRACSVSIDSIVYDKKEESGMEKTLNIEGMMCEKCEAHVRKALEGLEGVSEVLEVSHDKGVAVVKMTSDIGEDTFKTAIDEAGYDFKGIK